MRIRFSGGSHRKLVNTNKKRLHQNLKKIGGLPYLIGLFSHSSPAITRKYLGIRAEEIRDIYLNL